MSELRCKMHEYSAWRVFADAVGQLVGGRRIADRGSDTITCLVHSGHVAESPIEAAIRISDNVDLLIYRDSI